MPIPQRYIAPHMQAVLQQRRSTSDSRTLTVVSIGLDEEGSTSGSCQAGKGDLLLATAKWVGGQRPDGCVLIVSFVATQEGRQGIKKEVLRCDCNLIAT